MCECSILMVNTDTLGHTIMLAKLFKRWFTQASYSSELEQYIISHNPQNGGDIERLTRQFDTQLSQGKIL